MEITPIQVTDEGVLIPRHYLKDAESFEVVVAGEYLLVRPRPNGEPPKTVQEPRYSWIGMAESGNPNASVEVEEVLEAEIDRRDGWTVDPYPHDES